MEEKQLKVRNAGHKPLNDFIRTDWSSYIKIHPDHFDVLLFKPTDLQQTAPAEVDEEVPLFGDLNDHQDNIEYKEPDIVHALESTSEGEGFLTMWDGDDSMGMDETSILMLRLSDPNVPEGSIINFVEELADGSERQAYWYVHKSLTYGTASVGAIHYCIPCGDLERSLVAPVEPNEN